jgi:hypothetical protein
MSKLKKTKCVRTNLVASLLVVGQKLAHLSQVVQRLVLFGFGASPALRFGVVFLVDLVTPKSFLKMKEYNLCIS